MFLFLPLGPHETDLVEVFPAISIQCPPRSLFDYIFDYSIVITPSDIKSLLLTLLFRLNCCQNVCHLIGFIDGLVEHLVHSDLETHHEIF